MKSSPSSVLHIASPQAAAPTQSVAFLQAAISPQRDKVSSISTPNKRIKQVLVDSEDRVKRRKGEDNIKTLDYKGIEVFRQQIYCVYYKYFSKLCDPSKINGLTPNFLWQAFDSYVDSMAKSLTDDSFDPADLSIILLSIERGLPIFVDNKSMKNQIHGKLLRYALVKDVCIVDINDIKSLGITKAGIFDFCKKIFGDSKTWGMNLDGVIGIADTGFISGLANEDIWDLSLEDAFISPGFVAKELERITAKHTIQYRAATSEDIVQQQYKRQSYMQLMVKSSLVPDVLKLVAQPLPDENVLHLLSDLMTLVENKLGHLDKGIVTNMKKLIKTCVSYRSVIENYTCSKEEINYLYAVYKIIYGDYAISKERFLCEDFLNEVTTIEGLTAVLDNFSAEKATVNRSMKTLKEIMHEIELSKSKNSYDHNTKIKSMVMESNEAFGPLYNVYRSLAADETNKDIKNVHDKLFMEFNNYLFELLDAESFHNSKSNKGIIRETSQKLNSLADSLSKVFKEINMATKAARNTGVAIAPSSPTNLIAKLDACVLFSNESSSLPGSGGGSLSTVSHDSKSSLSSRSFSYNVANNQPIMNINKRLISPGKENRFASSAT